MCLNTHLSVEMQVHTHKFVLYAMTPLTDGFSSALVKLYMNLRGQTFLLELVKLSVPYTSVLLFWLVRPGNKKVPLAWKELLSVMEVGLFSEVHFLSTVLPAVSLDTLFAHSHGRTLLW